MIRWVFFDVGNTLFSEDAAFATVYKRLLEEIRASGTEMTYEELMADRERITRESRAYAPFVQQAKAHLGDEGQERFIERYRSELYKRWAEINPPIPGMKELVYELAEWGVNLGIIANQPQECVDLLKRHDLWDIFQIRGISDLVDFKKPSKYFYVWALEASECPPEQAVMIGDRVDNDVAPAKQAGMKTIWFPCTPEAKGPWPDMDDADHLYRSSISRASGSALEPTSSEEEPHRVARTVDELREALKVMLKGG